MHHTLESFHIAYSELNLLICKHEYRILIITDFSETVDPHIVEGMVSEVINSQIEYSQLFNIFPKIEPNWQTTYLKIIKKSYLIITISGSVAQFSEIEGGVKIGENNQR